MTSPSSLSNFPSAVPVASFLAAIREPLRAAGLTGPEDALFLELRLRNPTRQDYPERFDFRVLRGDEILCHLAVGRDLRDLRARTEAFSAGCPALAARVFFWHSAGGWDFLGTDYFAGASITVSAGSMPGADLAAGIELARIALRETRQPSTPAALAQEFRPLRQAVLDLPGWGRFDRVLLDDIVFPFIEAGLMTVRPETRWTNGDFIPDNLLIDRDGRVRLVDYEFAQRTHFFALDEWRWHRFAGRAVREQGLATDAAAQPAWLEALGWLQHAVMLHAIGPAAIAQADTVLCARELLAALSRGHGSFRGELLLRHLPASAPLRPVAQLFWSADGAFTEVRSQSLAYDPGKGAMLRFTVPRHHGPLHLRFDPADQAGVVALSGLRILCESDATLLADWDAAMIAEHCLPAGTLLKLEPTATANYLSSGSDPRFVLAQFDAGEEPRTFHCEITLRFSTSLESLALLLPRDHASLNEARRIVAELQRRHEELIQMLYAQNEALLDHEHRNRRAAAERASLETELHQARHRIADLDAVITSKVEQIAVAMDRAAEFENERNALRQQFAETSARLQAEESRPLVRLDRFIRCAPPASNRERVI